MQRLLLSAHTNKQTHRIKVLIYKIRIFLIFLAKYINQINGPENVLDIKLKERKTIDLSRCDQRSSQRRESACDLI